MAITFDYSGKLKKITSDTDEVRNSILNSRKAILNINNAFLKRTKIRSEIFQRRQELNRRRLENESRREQEDVLEYSKMSSISKTPGLALARTGKSFLGRIMDFISNLAIGWLLYNLPTWIGMAKEFVGRVIKLGNIIGTIVSNASGIVISLGQGLVNIVGDIAKLNFAALPNDVFSAFNKVQTNIDNMGKQFEEGFQLFSTGLDKSLTGTDIPKVGQPLPEQPYEPGLTSSGEAPRAPATANAGYRRVYEAARAAGDPFPEVTAAQWAIESGYGKSPSGKNNPFGQKAGANEPGTYMMTTENINGRDVRVRAKFRDFASEEEAIKYRLSRFGYKYGNARTPEEAIRNLQIPGGGRIPGTNEISHGIYATDPNYVSKITSKIREEGGNPQRLKTVSGGAPAMNPLASSSGGKVIQYLTGDRTHPRYAADHAAGNYHDHIGFDSQATRDAAMRFLTGKGWTIGSINTGKHAAGSLHYKNLAFDIPFYPNQSRKGVPNNAKGETALSSRLRADLIAGGFSGPQLGGGSGGSSAAVSATPGTGAMTAAGLTPTSVGEDISVVIPEMGLSSSGGGGGGGQESYGGGMAPAESPATVLNNFVKNHLLVELAYL